KAAEYAYFLGSNVHKVRARTLTEPEGIGAAGSYLEAWSYLDGRGRILLSLRSGDAGSWIVSGMNRTGGDGRLFEVHRPFQWDGAPNAVPLEWPYQDYPGTVHEYND